MAKFLLTAEAADRPGIVAAMSSTIASKNWSIEDASMTRLAGRFVMLFVVSADDSVASIEAVVREASPDMRVSVEAIDAVPDTKSPGETWAVTVYGSDRPGIVSAITTVLAERNVNIEDLSTRVYGSADTSTYTMLMDVTVPDSVDGAALASELATVGESLGVTCHAMPVDADVL